MPKPMIADHEMTMAFFIRSRLCRFQSIDDRSSAYNKKESDVPECCFTGIQTSTKGFVVFKGDTILLNIHFTPVGFFHIFDVKPQELVDVIGDNEDILSREITCLHNNLQECSTLSKCVCLVEQYLIKKLFSNKRKYRHAGIMSASHLLTKQNGLYSITKLAYDCNMTLQTFEVQFTEQVGLNPKLFSRLLRFGNAVNIKLYQPRRKWTDIAIHCGYFDQTHFIKEFKEFTLLSPKKFISTMNPVLEDFERE